jgi:hypothetical protein
MMPWTAPSTGIAMCQNAVAMVWQPSFHQFLLKGSSWLHRDHLAAWAAGRKCDPKADVLAKHRGRPKWDHSGVHGTFARRLGRLAPA